MDLDEEIKTLRRYLDQLAAEDDGALARYELSWPRMPPGWYWQSRWIVGWTLRWLEWVGLKNVDPWPATLKHHVEKADALPILIWAVGNDRQQLRNACRALTDLQHGFRGFVPILVTDSADFAFFSRLPWLVEYLPSFSGDGEPYEERKARHLARLYRGAPALPANVVAETGAPTELRRLIVVASPGSGAQPR